MKSVIEENPLSITCLQNVEHVSTTVMVNQNNQSMIKTLRKSVKQDIMDIKRAFINERKKNTKY